METKELIDCLGKDAMTHWEAARLIEKVAEILKAVDGATMLDIGQARDDMKAVVDSAKNLGSKLLAMQEEITKAEEAVYRMYEESYGRVIKKRREIEERMSAPMPEIRVPYGIKEFIDAAERLERLTPEAWTRFVEFAKALRG